MAQGIVSSFDARRGTGVITDDTGVEVPVAAAEIDGGGRQSLTEGDQVVFTVTDDPARTAATNVYVP